MKVLIVHNFYGREAPSGENQIVIDEIEQLRRRGDEVVLFQYKSDDVRRFGFWGQIIAGCAYLLNFISAIRLSLLIKSEKPDIVHIHNTFPLISLWCLYAIKLRTPVVMTLHNYRLFCPAGIPMRSGVVCTKCIDRRNVWWSIRYRCYRGSRIATLPLAGSIAIHRQLGTLNRLVDKFIVLTPYAAEKFIRAGLSKAKVEIRANGYDPGEQKQLITPSSQGKKLEVIYVGRLSVEKGIKQILNVWKRLGDDAPQLTLVGEGDLSAEVQSTINEFGLKIHLVGGVPRDRIPGYISRARLVLIPSICIEGLPTVLLEASALGVPLLVSNIGPLPDLVSDEVGYVTNPHDTQQFANKILFALNDPDLEKKGSRAKLLYTEKYTYKASLVRLNEIYASASRS